jgi:hypothetical protein
MNVIAAVATQGLTGAGGKGANASLRRSAGRCPPIGAAMLARALLLALAGTTQPIAFA